MSENLESQLVMRVLTIQSKIQKKVGAALSAHGIGLSEFLVLKHLLLSVDHKMRRSDLAEKVGLTPSGITRLLNPMEKIGLIGKEDNPRDARVSLVTLSETGKRITVEASISFEFAASSLFDSLDKKQLKQLSDVLHVVAK